MLGKTTKGLGDHVTELRRLTVDYAKQETVEPLKGLIRFLIFGAAGSILLGIGLILWIMAGLRALQTETGSTFTGNLSWAPYALTLVGAVVVIALAISAIGKERRLAAKRQERRRAEVGQ